MHGSKHRVATRKSAAFLSILHACAINFFILLMFACVFGFARYRAFARYASLLRLSLRDTPLNDWHLQAFRGDKTRSMERLYKVMLLVSNNTIVIIQPGTDRIILSSNYIL